jgi:mRNA interferase RelE/StbE
MRKFQVIVSHSAEKELHALERLILRRVMPKIMALEKEPRPEGCRKIQGQESLWRIRVGDYRVLYAIDDDQAIVDVVAVRHRREAYR